MNTKNQIIDKARKQATQRIFSRYQVPAQIGSVLLLTLAMPLGGMIGGRLATLGVMGTAAMLPVLSLTTGYGVARRLRDDHELLLQNLNDEETHTLITTLDALGDDQTTLGGEDDDYPSEDDEDCSEDDFEGYQNDSENILDHSEKDPFQSLNIPYNPITLDPDVPHLTVISGTRQGKSNTVRELLRGVQNIEYISSKRTDEIPAGWKGFFIGGSVEERGLKIEWIVNRWENILSDHANNPDQPPIFLVFDEAVQLTAYAKNSGIKNLLERYEALINEVLTQGAAIGVYGAILAQTKNATTLGLSLDLLRQNSNLIVPVKNKRNFSIGIVEKLGGLNLSDEQKTEIRNLQSEYFQLWITQDDTLAYDQLRQYRGSLKGLDKINLDNNPEINLEDDFRMMIGGDSEDYSTPQLGMFEDPELTPIQQKIITHLEKTRLKKTASKVRESVTTSRDNPRLKTAEIQNELDYLADLVLIHREEIDSKVYYWAID